MPATSAASFKGILQWPLTLLTRHTRWAVHAINQSIFLRCLWLKLIMTLLIMTILQTLKTCDITYNDVCNVEFIHAVSKVILSKVIISKVILSSHYKLSHYK